eukprot:4743346-Pleurochrysis_carterae.AAC.1
MHQNALLIRHDVIPFQALAPPCFGMSHKSAFVQPAPLARQRSGAGLRCPGVVPFHYCAFHSGE